MTILSSSSTLGWISLTFCFLRRITFTPSTDTMMLTFFFLMFLALNSYWWEEKPKFKRVLGVPGTVCGSQCPDMKILAAEGHGNLFYSAEKNRIGKALLQ